MNQPPTLDFRTYESGRECSKSSRRSREHRAAITLFHVASWTALNAIMLGARAGLHGQPQQPERPTHQILPANASQAVSRLRASYRSGAVAQRVTFLLNDEDAAPGNAERSVVVRIFAGVSPAAADRAVRIDFPDMVVHCSAGRMVVTRPSDPSGYAEWPIDETPIVPMLERVLPPLALPQLALAFGDPDFARPTPFGDVASWRLEPVPGVEAEVLTRLIGTGNDATTELVFDGVTDRLSAFTIKPVPGRAGVEVRARCEAVDPGPRSSWAIGLDGRTRVASIADLRTTVSELGVGDVLSDLSFQDRHDVRWSLGAAMAGAVDPDVGVLLLFRPDPGSDGGISPDVAAGIAALQTCWRRSVLRDAERESGGTNSVRSRLVLGRGVAVFRLEAFAREGLERLFVSWADEAESQSKHGVRTLPGAQGLLWAPTGVSSIDRIAPDSRAVLVVVRADRTIRAIVRLDGRGAEPAAITAELDDITR